MSGLDANVAVERDGFRVEIWLDVPPRTTLALLGPNGAGKSTVIEALAGYLPLDQGQVLLNGRTLEAWNGPWVPPHQRGIGIVHQDYALFPHLDVLDNIAFGPRSRMSRSAARKVAAGWIEPMGLVGLEHRTPSDLSGGQAQRVALARALANDPEMLLLDEPLAALDVVTKAALRTLLADHLLTFEGPRILITHDPIDVLLLADEVVVVENGSVVQRDTVESLRRHPATPYVAAVSGTNLLQGTQRRDMVTVDQHHGVDGVELMVGSSEFEGRVVVVIDPASVALYPEEPQGSPRNRWLTEVATLERRGDRVRVQLGDPLPLMVDVTAASAESLLLAPGSAIWASVKATEISCQPA